MNLHSLTRVASLEAAHRRKYGIHAVPEYMQTGHLYYQSTDVKANDKWTERKSRPFGA